MGISRNGEIPFLDGKHRLAIAKLFGIIEVPVIVNYLHEEYIKQVKSNTKNKKLTPSIAIEPAIKKHNTRGTAENSKNNSNLLTGR